MTFTRKHKRTKRNKRYAKQNKKYTKRNKKYSKRFNYVGKGKSMNKRMQETANANDSGLVLNPQVFKDTMMPQLKDKYKLIFDKINFKNACSNISPDIINVLKWYIDKKIIRIEDMNIEDDVWDILSGNPATISLLQERYPDKIKINSLCENPQGIDLILRIDKTNINWPKLASNSSATFLFREALKRIKDNVRQEPEAEVLEPEQESKALEQEPLEQEPLESEVPIENMVNYIVVNNIMDDANVWEQLSKMSSISDLFEENIDKINWISVCSNTSSIAINLVQQRLLGDLLLPENNTKSLKYWKQLSANPAALVILNANLDKINVEWLSKNQNPQAINLLSELLRTTPVVDRRIMKKIWENLTSNKTKEAVTLCFENMGVVFTNQCVENLFNNPVALTNGLLKNRRIQDLLITESVRNYGWFASNPCIFNNCNYEQYEEQYDETAFQYVLK
jgi:hypothetical protein